MQNNRAGSLYLKCHCTFLSVKAYRDTGGKQLSTCAQCPWYQHNRRLIAWAWLGLETADSSHQEGDDIILRWCIADQTNGWSGMRLLDCRHIRIRGLVIQQLINFPKISLLSISLITKVVTYNIVNLTMLSVISLCWQEYSGVINSSLAVIPLLINSYRSVLKVIYYFLWCKTRAVCKVLLYFTTTPCRRHQERIYFGPQEQETGRHT